MFLALWWAFLYVNELSLQARWESADLDECHFLSICLDVCFRVRILAFYHGASFLRFVNFFSGATIQSNTVCHVAVVSLTKQSVFAICDNLWLWFHELICVNRMTSLTGQCWSLFYHSNRFFSSVTRWVALQINCDLFLLFTLQLGFYFSDLLCTRTTWLMCVIAQA